MQEIANNIKIQNTRLVVRITQKTMAFAAVDSAAQGGLAFEPYTVRSGISMAANLREAFKKSALLMRGYQRINVLIDTPPMITPIEEFHEEDMLQLYAYTFKMNDSDTLVHHVLPELNAVAVFPVNKDLKLVVDDHFADVRITPLMRSVWTHLHRRSFNGARRKLYGYFHDKRLDIFAFDKNRFRFYNTFTTANARDAVYFLLYVWKQLALDSIHDEMHLAGEIPDREWLKAALIEFVKKTYIINPSADFNRAPVTAIPNLPYDLLTLFVKGVKEPAK